MESNISWTELKDQDLGTGRYTNSKNCRELQPGRNSPLLPTFRPGNNPRGKGISGYKLQYEIDHVYFLGIILSFPQGNLTHTVSCQFLKSELSKWICFLTINRAWRTSVLLAVHKLGKFVRVQYLK